MAKVDYAASAAQIVELVGGVQNVKSVTHCITRVRFQLKDFGIAHDNLEAVSAVPWFGTPFTETFIRRTTSRL